MGDNFRAILDDPDALREASDAVFDHFDTDGSGQISKTEIREALAQVARDLKQPPPTDLEETLNKLDTDGSRTISKAEFVPLVRDIFEKIANS